MKKKEKGILIDKKKSLSCERLLNEVPSRFELLYTVLQTAT